MKHPNETLNLNYLWKKYKGEICIFCIMILSFFLNFYAIGKNGYANTYYAAAIKSMTMSFKNFFFVAFDPSGLVSVDKPPLGFWLQAVFALLFGYHGWSMILPQALCGTLSTFMMYRIMKRLFSKRAGLLAALVFCLTPIVVAVSRNNTIDMTLIFVLLLAVDFLFQSIVKKKWRYLFVAAIFIGLGFNVKMLQAYLVLPAFVLTYLFFAQESIGKRWIAGILSIVIMSAVSLSWVVAVDLYPASSRPYVDSSTNNTVSELIIGHNGIERLEGRNNQGSGNFSHKMASGGGSSSSTQNGLPPAPPSTSQTNQAQNTTQKDRNRPSSLPATASDSKTEGQPPSQNSNSFEHAMPQKGGAMPTNNPAMGGGNSNDEIGTASITRLWSSNLYGQSSWLFIFCFLSLLLFVRKLLKDKEKNPANMARVFWGLWFLTMFLFFSFAGFYHRYYLCMLAPAVAALVGMGLQDMIEGIQKKDAFSIGVFSIALLGTIGVSAYVVFSYSAIRIWLIPIMAAGAVAAWIALLVYGKTKRKIWINAVCVCAAVSMLAAPAYWSLTPVLGVGNASKPYADPSLLSSSDSKMNAEEELSSGLEKYLVKHYQKGSYLVVARRSNTVASMIIHTGLPAYAYGGFLGSANTLSLEELKAQVKSGKITYFLLSEEGEGFSKMKEKSTEEASSTVQTKDTKKTDVSLKEDNDIETYVKENATLIDSSEYQSDSSNHQRSGSLYLFHSQS